MRSLPVSLRSFFENLHVQGLVSNQLLPSRILFLEGFELLDHLRLHLTLLLSPPIVSLLGNLKLPTDFWNLLPLAEFNIRTTQLGDDLIHTMTFRTHLKESFPGLRPDRILSLKLEQF